MLGSHIFAEAGQYVEQQPDSHEGSFLPLVLVKNQSSLDRPLTLPRSADAIQALKVGDKKSSRNYSINNRIADPPQNPKK